MKIFTNKGVFKKLLIVIIAILLFSAVVPTKVSYAADDVASKVGGTLLSPIASLMIGFGDVVMNLIHNIIYDMDSSYILITRGSDGWGIFWTVVAAVLAIVVVAAVAYLTAGAGVALLAKLGITATIGAGTIGTIVTVSLGAGALAGSLTALEWFGDNVVFPMYQISPEEIFKGEVGLLDINFFKSEDEVTDEEIDPNTAMIGNKVSVLGTPINATITTTNNSGGSRTSLNISSIEEGKNYINDILKKYGYNGQGFECSFNMKNEEKTLEWNYQSKSYKATLSTQYNGPQATNYTRDYSYSYTYTLKITQNGVDVLAIPVVLSYSETRNTSGNAINIGLSDTEGNFKEIANKRINYALHNYAYNGEINIFSNEFWQNGDGTKFFKWSNDLDAYEAQLTRTTTTTTTGQHTGTSIATNTTYSLDIFKGEWIGAEKTTLGIELSPTIAKWYYAIRNFVLIAMMVILLYIGIRIMLSGISSEKAKYKNMLMDWLVAICLVFIMHYIMVFAMNLVDGITNIFTAVGNGEEPYANIYEIDADLEEKLKNELSQKGINIEEYIVKEGGQVVTNEKGNKYFLWDAKNIIGMARIQAALAESGTLTYIGYGMIFLVLVFYTMFFLYTYLRRALYLTFFTIISPLVAMTYPIDKLHDGKAQAFNMWFKEYIFNLAIQPVHLLLYTVLISSAFELAATNMLYTLVAIGFMMPAEKFIRKMFGFDKAQTPGFLSGAAGTALMVTGFNKLFHKKPSKGGNIIEDGEKSNKEDKINMKDDSAVDPFLLAQKSEAKQNDNAINVLLNQENQRKMDEARIKMEQAKVKAQSFKPGDIDLNKTRKPNNYTFDMSDQVRKQLQEKSEKLRESQKQENKKKDGFFARQAKGIKSASKAYAKKKLQRFGTNLSSGKTIRNIAKTAGGLYLGAAGGLLGATIGLSSGDGKNVWQYGSTLGVAGYALGARDIKSDPDIGMAYKEYERAQYGSEEEYREHLLEEQRKAVAENEKYLNQLRVYLKLNDLNEAKDYMQEYGDCIDAGITDMEDLATIIKAVEEKEWDREMAITAAKYFKKAGGKPKNMNKRDRENIEYQYKNIVKSNGITDEKEVEETVKIMLKNLDIYGKIKDDLTQV